MTNEQTGNNNRNINASNSHLIKNVSKIVNNAEPVDSRKRMLTIILVIHLVIFLITSFGFYYFMEHFCHNT